MKKDIHPTYYPNAKIICACGNTFTTGSTVKEMKVEICSKCHPFFTGKQKLVDTQGRVDRFKKILEKKEKIAGKRKNINSRAVKQKIKKVKQEKKETEKQ